MSAEHRLDHAVVSIFRPLCKIRIFFDTLCGLLLTVALGNLVAEAGTDACFFYDIADCEQGTRDLSKACMVVEDRGHAIADTV